MKSGFISIRLVTIGTLAVILAVAGIMILRRGQARRLGANNPAASPVLQPVPPTTTNSPITTDRPSHTPAARVAELLKKLEAGVDHSTGREFAIGPGGKLTGAPTERVALLDELGHLDPRAAAAYAEKILSEFNSADE